MKTIIEQLNQVSEKINILESSGHFKVFNSNNEWFAMKSDSKEYQNMLQYLYDKQAELVKELHEELCEKQKRQ